MSNILSKPKKHVVAFGKVAGRVTKDAAGKVGDGAAIIKDKAGEGALILKDRAIEAKEGMDRVKYGPVFGVDEIYDNMPKLIFITDHNKAKIDKLFGNAVGFRKDPNGVSMLGLFPENISILDVKYYPSDNGVLYYKDPFDDHLYINIENYFSYLEERRVNEIMDVAHTLGARRVQIVYKEEKKSLVSANATVSHNAEGRGKLKVVPHGNAQVNHKIKNNEYVNVKVLAETEYDGSTEPKEPTLTYLQGDSHIRSLITRRMDPDKGMDLRKDVYQIECKSLKGLHKSDAARIDGVIKKFKIGGNGSVTSEVEKENRSILEITVEF